MTDQNKTSISVFLVIGPECMLPRCMLPLACHGEYMMGQTDRQTHGWTPDHYIMLFTRCSQRNNQETVKLTERNFDKSKR